MQSLETEVKRAPVAGAKINGGCHANHAIALSRAIKDPDRIAAKRAFDAMMHMTKIDIATIERAHRG